MTLTPRDLPTIGLGCAGPVNHKGRAARGASPGHEFRPPRSSAEAMGTAGLHRSTQKTHTSTQRPLQAVGFVRLLFQGHSRIPSWRFTGHVATERSGLASIPEYSRESSRPRLWPAPPRGVEKLVSGSRGRSIALPRSGRGTLRPSPICYDGARAEDRRVGADSRLNWGRFGSGGEHGAALGVRAGLRQ